MPTTTSTRTIQVRLSAADGLDALHRAQRILERGKLSGFHVEAPAAVASRHHGLWTVSLSGAGDSTDLVFWCESYGGSVYIDDQAVDGVFGEA